MSRKTDLQKLKDMTLEAADAMIRKLTDKYDEGYRGDDDPEMFNFLVRELDIHLGKFTKKAIDVKNIIDIMNLLAMIRRLIIIHGKTLSDRIEEETGEPKTRDWTTEEYNQFSRDREKRIKEKTKELPPESVTWGKSTPASGKAEEAMEEAGLRGAEAGRKLKQEGSKDKKSFEIIPLLPKGAEGVSFFLFESYAYIDKKKGIHHIRFAEIDIEVFMYQIISIGNYKLYWKYYGKREELFALVEDKIKEHFKLK